jgi:ABC-2 type transport system permease protein
MRQALHAEWTKLRTVRGTGWLLLAAVALTIALSVAAAAAASCPSGGCSQDPTKISLTGVQLGQAVIAILAVLVVSGEYSTGMIHTTLAAIPRRPTVLAAKALTVSGVVLGAGIVAVLGSLLAGRLLLPALSLGDGPTLRAAVGSVLYLILIALLSLGVATAVRDPATAIGVVLALLYLFPILAEMVTDPSWKRHLAQIGPMDAGLAIQKTTNLPGMPISPWAGLGVLTAWATAALLAGALLLHQRDA